MMIMSWSQTKQMQSQEFEGLGQVTSHNIAPSVTNIERNYKYGTTQ